MNSQKILIYQVLPRLLGNTRTTNIQNGTIEENGCGKFNDITGKFLHQLKKNGYSHVWFIGVLAHASATDYTTYGIPREYPEIIKGMAGSPYAVRDYYDVDPDLAVNVNNRMREFEAMIERVHNVGMKVIIDFIPNHLARNYQSVNRPKRTKEFGSNDDNSVAFSPANNFYYLPGEELEIQFPVKKMAEVSYKESPAKVTGNDCFTNRPTQYDWYETVKLNYGVDMQNGNVKHFDKIPDTWKKMKDVLMFWSKKKIDGFRVDMAEMVPLEFWQWAIPQVKKKFPDMIFLAEIYNPDAYRSFLAHNNFDYLYDKVGLYDVLRDVACGYRPSSDITFTLNNVGDIQRQMLNFIENHDEQRVASDYFLKNGKDGKAAMIVSACVNTNPLMVYFGQELGERGMDQEGFSGKNGRTTIFDYWSVDTVRRWNNNGKWNETLLTNEEKDLKKFYAKLLTLCNKEKSLYAGRFYDLMSANYDNPEFDSTRQFAFLRGVENELILVVVNFDNKDAEVAVHIPTHALEFFLMAQNESFKAFPLLFNSKLRLSFSVNNPLRVTVSANSGELYKISAL
ncbi:MAG: alpha-amylase family protein [Bacteroidia bacterium]|nr:alpha-amylase family protein [Bacteroidia bacterium]